MVLTLNYVKYFGGDSNSNEIHFDAGAKYLQRCQLKIKDVGNGHKSG